MKKSVLIIDDDVSAQILLQKIVMDKGYECIIRSNGKEGLEALEEENVSFIFTDYKMPVMDGLAMIKKIHKNPKWSHIPIVLISGHVSFKEAGKFLEYGVKGFMEKPFNINGIENFLEQYKPLI